jgi:hypothetical protein
MIDLRGEAHFRKRSLLQRSIFSAPLFLNFGMHHVVSIYLPPFSPEFVYFSLKTMSGQLLLELELRCVWDTISQVKVHSLA